jgi:hypothetical protein
MADTSSDFQQSRTEFEKARAAFASAAATLPQKFLDNNADRLLLIAEELRRSYGVELRLVRMIDDLDLANPDELRRLASSVRYYAADRFYERDRTHCHNIFLLAEEWERPHHTGFPDEEKIGAFKRLIAPLMEADNDIMFELEPLADDAVKALDDIEAALRAAEAGDASARSRAEQAKRAFVEGAQGRLRREERLRELSKLSQNLIDLAAGRKA